MQSNSKNHQDLSTGSKSKDGSDTDSSIKKTLIYVGRQCRRTLAAAFREHSEDELRLQERCINGFFLRYFLTWRRREMIDIYFS